MDTIRPSRTETFQHTIGGLLGKRVELFQEAERLRDRIAEIKNVLGALDRTLTTLGYEGPLDEVMPRQRRHVVFGTGELTSAILAELRVAETVLTTRDIARQVVTVREEDPDDRKYLSDVVKRVGKALRALRDKGVAVSAPNTAGVVTWRLRSKALPPATSDADHSST